MLWDILFDYQKEDVMRLADIPRGIIGSQMGTGKTEVFLGLCEKLQPERVLIAVPKTMVLEWRDRIAKRLGEEAAIPDGIEDQKYVRFSLGMDHFRKRYLVVNHEMLRMERYVKILSMVPWSIVAFDEAHRFKSKKALQTRGARELAFKAERVYHITGTPQINYADDLWSLLFMLEPKEFNDYNRFVGKYCVSIGSPWGPRIVGNNHKTIGELRERLHQLMVRREKKDVLPWLKKLPPRDIPIPMAPAQFKAYQSMEEEFVVALQDGMKLFAKESLAQLMRLRQLALDPGIIDVDAPSAKTEALLDIINDMDEKVVVFSWFSSYIKRLHNKLNKTPHGIITGDNPGERYAQYQAFQNDPSIKVMLATMGAGGEGIDLYAASTVIFTDVFWTPAANEQAEDRLHRIGQTEEVTVIRLVHPGTIDSDMHKILGRKDKAFSETVAIKEAVDTMLERH